MCCVSSQLILARMSTATNVIVFISLYLLGLGLFQLLGGLGAAAEAFKRWGEARSRVDRR
jgi:hypothetical protein